MNVLSGEFWLALLNIVFIDLILAGDNAIVIALAARNLPKDQQKKAVIWGTVGAISIRIIATLLVVKLLNLPWLHLVGGLLLIWIAFKLLVQEEQHDNVKAGNTLWQSVQTIIIADAAMGLDNVIAVAGAAQGHTLLVIIGLLISVPVIVWGSTLFIKLVDRFKWIIYLGAAVLAYTASKMFIDEHKFGNLFEANVWLQWLLKIVLIVGVLGLGYMVNKRNARKATATA
ncbi:MAG: TerC family protein [Candidatus Pristimantibacillus lignocellulolyticus]|uniref:TerC family protein n=1 Tax=Candidatus Pristimantibacillus lignocellulolyticus TaxID=2994561 RepID=A0A9J6ZAE9_9BACL|nr:MAG: TerC family protein [Candidatus Pristimantibacillus lignocellulolyticus]